MMPTHVASNCGWCTGGLSLDVTTATSSGWNVQAQSILYTATNMISSALTSYSPSFSSGQATTVNGWYQSQVADNFYRQLQMMGYAQNQAAYNQVGHPRPEPPRPEPPAHVAAQKVVRNRARRLLMSALSPAQKATYACNGYFDVVVGGNVYRIHQGTHGNVRELGGDGREKYLWCAQPDHVPAEDAMLAQMLLLKHDEAAFRRVANRRPI